MALQGQEIIRKISRTLPRQPGVYQMINEKGEILYIGKAKNIFNRVKSYLSINSLTRRIQRIYDFIKRQENRRMGRNIWNDTIK